MKRILTLIVCMMSISMTLFAASSAKCLLQHKGGVKTFDASAIDTAIKNAVDGDTIFLTEGQFPGFTVNKKITVRGAGQTSHITGDVKISISNNPTLTQTVLEGLDLGGYEISLATAMNGVKLKQCSAGYLTCGANNDNLFIDRCSIGRTGSYSGLKYKYIKGLTAINSFLTMGYDSTSSGSFSFVNCNVMLYTPSTSYGDFINSIIVVRDTNADTYSDNAIKNSNFSYCLINKQYYYRLSNYTHGGTSVEIDDSSCTTNNCSYTYDYSTKEYSKQYLEDSGYLGNDGTVVGRYGGLTPYTLDLAVPKVTENTITLDPTTRTLNVSLKVTAN